MIYLYIKQHSETGLKYFGKTIQDPYSYPGSGNHWRNHYRKHGGPSKIKTLEVFEFEDQDECTAFALKFSKDNNIVESKEWANQIIEDGIGTGFTAGCEFSEEHKSKLSKAAKNRIVSEHTKKKMSESHKDKIKTPEHIAKLNESKIGRPRSEETKRKLSEANLGKKASEETKAKLKEIALNRAPEEKAALTEKKRETYRIKYGTDWIPKTEEQNKKIAEALKGRKASDETRRKQSERAKGRIPWNKGLKKDTDPRVLRNADAVRRAKNK